MYSSSPTSAENSSGSTSDTPSPWPTSTVTGKYCYLDRCNIFKSAPSSRFTGFITARKRSLRRLCFHRCLSVHGGVCLPIACWDTHPLEQVHPLGRYTPWAGTPLGRYIPKQVHPQQVHTPWAGTPPAQCMLGYTLPCPVHARVHPPLPPPCTVHAGIWSTSGRYASHWNAFLLILWYSAKSRNPIKILHNQ